MDRQPCGTNAAYQAHIRRREKTCDACRAAHTLYMRAVRTGSTEPRKASPCGTQEGYMHHRYTGVPTCAPCRVAHNAYTRAWRARRKRAEALDAAWAEVLAETAGAA